MKLVIPFFLSSLILLGCANPEPTSNHKILDEYLLLNYNSWNYMRNARYDMIPQYQVNDTIVLKSEIRLLIIPNDTIVDIPLTPENFVDFKELDMIKLTSSNDTKFYKHFFNFITIDRDSTIKGVITSDELAICQEGPMSPITEKNMFLQRVLEQRNYFDQHIKELAVKHGMSEDSLFKTLAKEYYQTTGNPIFVH